MIDRINDRLLPRRRRLLGEYAIFKQRFSRNQEPIFRDGLESFAVLLKGKSIEKIKNVYGNYGDCFIVNNFDEEIELLETYLISKNTVHFVNRLMTAPLTATNYEKLGISDIQLSKVSAKGDAMLKEAVGYYQSLNLRTRFLPERLLRFNRSFGPEYAHKHPNTGVLAILYALDIIRPRNLWIVGLDFYQSDYLIRRPWQSPIETQRKKMKRIDLAGALVEILKGYPDVHVNLVTYYEGLPELENLSIL